jgi:ubiquinone/menaquinone biosynthesis C-methylase UbiE
LRHLRSQIDDLRNSTEDRLANTSQWLGNLSQSATHLEGRVEFIRRELEQERSVINSFPNLFIDPTSRDQLQLSEDARYLVSGRTSYAISNGVIDFLTPIRTNCNIESCDQESKARFAEARDNAPELKAAHDRAFEDAESENGNIYGPLDSLPLITQSGHFRRMELLASLDLGGLSDKVVVDFGTGPWGFAAIFPKLREAAACIGFDVSNVALQQARQRTPDELSVKTIYATTDGDFIPLADSSIDVFFGGEVIEHVRNPLLFIQEIARVCRDGAHVILTTPNRDAVNYYLRKQPYCVGPEHVALMNAVEFRQAIETFCELDRILGYESSLSPDLDLMPAHPEVLHQIQQRAENFPELASGMIAIARVSKEKYSANKRCLHRREYPWNSSDVQISGPVQSLRLFSDIHGLLLQDGMWIHIPIAGTEPVLLFWGHDWSGEVEIVYGSTTITKDLYLDHGGFFRINLSFSEPTETGLFVRHKGTKCENSHSDQVIFYKAIDYFDPAKKYSPLRAHLADGMRNYFAKHKKLHRHLCCPKCHGELEYPDAVTLEGIPLVGRVACKVCGDIGRVANMKYLFNAELAAQQTLIPEDLAGAVDVFEVELPDHLFTPQGAWHKADNGQFHSDAPGSKFSISTDALGIALIFLKHPWSGIANICVDGRETQQIDLFEEEGSMQYWYPIHLGSGSHLIEVENPGLKNRKSHATQVWLLCAEEVRYSENSMSAIRYSSRNSGNQYPAKFLELLSSTAEDGLVLDCGSGDRNHPDPRVINFEYSRFRSPDAFGDGHCLPFKDNSFDLILSQAVIEHLHDPFVAVSELFRVLKPGGRVYCESAFMQPLHAVPYHFFNTTVWGIERLFKDFEAIEVGFEGCLSQSLEWFYSLTALRSKGLGDKLDQLLALAKGLDADITREELKKFSSCVTLLARKPFRASC